jgi:hypothetical protein
MGLKTGDTLNSGAKAAARSRSRGDQAALLRAGSALAEAAFDLPVLIDEHLAQDEGVVVQLVSTAEV